MTLVTVDVDDIVGKLFEQPEMDEETRILYIVGILGGPTSPYQILPAYYPGADLAWFILEYMSKAIFDALEKFKDGEYNELQVRAAIYIARRVLANYLTGMPLDVVNAFGQLTALGQALAVLESGEMTLRKIPPARPEMPIEFDERANYYGFGGAEPPGSRGGTSDDRKWYQKVWDGIVGVGKAISDGISAIGAWVQEKIDVAGEFYFGDSWTKMRETVNFENPYIQAAILVADLLIPGGILGGALKLAGWIGRAFIRVGLGIARGLAKGVGLLARSIGKIGETVGNAIAKRITSLINRPKPLIPHIKGGYIRFGSPPKLSHHAEMKIKDYMNRNVLSKARPIVHALEVFDRGKKYADLKYSRYTIVLGKGKRTRFIGYDHLSDEITTYVAASEFERNVYWNGRRRYIPVGFIGDIF